MASLLLATSAPPEDPRSRIADAWHLRPLRSVSRPRANVRRLPSIRLPAMVAIQRIALLSLYELTRFAAVNNATAPQSEVTGRPSCGQMSVPMATAWLLLIAAVAAAQPPSPIDRRALVSRHDVVLKKLDPEAPLSLGNGEFAFTADVTGLQ